ncbi:UDP-N-acetylmuramoyl-tripeptide--D-alanyl-D-alanine ligase [Coprobacillaceae bacterium CR2/5/TPMF4]|nr:UDP-N-acetylmuramoyl-tripeptide--D-alanyl-D-alanine ligase [Coprobacillaceae bacterium CR2/5/TPMF4]
MKVKEILAATDGKLLSGDSELEITGFSQDSRKVSNGMMYIPIIGERFDGHDFIQSAFDNGASAIITDRVIDDNKHTVILVKDTLKALQDMAHYLRNHRDVIVVGITGSVGKTSTRDMVYSVIKQQYRTLKTEGNYNNNIGLPLTILRLQDEQVMVLEMGMNHLKEMEELSLIANPDISAITNVGTAHIGELGSRENILKAKLEIIAGMKDGSTLVINNDNDMLSKVQIDRLQLLTVAVDNDGDFKADNVILKDDHSEFEIEYENKNILFMYRYQENILF